MSAFDPVEEHQRRRDSELERQGLRFGRSGSWFLVVGVVFVVPGCALVLLGHGWSLGVGVALLLIASAPVVIGIGLLVSAAVARWAARRKLFA